MKRAILLVTFLLAACSPAAPPTTDPTPASTSSATRPAPVVEQVGGPTPSAATVTAIAALPAIESPGEPQGTSTPEPSTPEPSPTPLGPTTINGVPLSDIIPLPPETIANIQAIYARGQALGRDPHAFSKLGDSTILNPHFLGPFDSGQYRLGEWGYLQETIDQYPGSFARYGIAAHAGLHSWTAFDPMWADKKWCEPGEHLLACEFRLQNPSVLFIRLGSNDAGSPSGFRYNVKQVIQYAIDNGVIPIIGTKADRFEGSNENNEILRELAAELYVPLWDFDILAETLPGRGLDKDGVHLIIDDFPHDFTDPAAFERGHAMQDLSALAALDQIRRTLRQGFAP